MNMAGTRQILEEPAPDRTSLAGRLIVLGTQMLRRTGKTALGDLPADDALLGLLAEEVYRDRRRRAQHLPARLLGEPAWDILLDLYVAAVRGQQVSVSNACLAAAAPASTALRWLSHLEAEGLVERLADAADARRHYVRLTPFGRARMSAYFAECRADLVAEPELAETLAWSEPPAAAASGRG